MRFQKSRTKTVISFILAILLFSGIGYRLFWINARYPSPGIQTYGLDESIQAGSYKITFSDWQQWADYDEYPDHQERTGIAELTISKTAPDESTLDLTSVAFESGAWGNQFDAELMFRLNPDLESLLLQLDTGETKKVLFPITMLDQQFTPEQWSRIDERVFYIVLQYYPEKLQFKIGR